MNRNFQNDSSSRKRNVMKAIMLFVLTGLTFHAIAQEGSQGNTSIFGGAQMSFFNSHNFITGGGGAQPGVILTERATNNFGILNFVGDNLTSTGVTNAGYVDGYVRKFGAGQFIFPVGDNGNAGQFAASADGTMGAYFFANPQIAVTSNLFTGGNYPALPSGAPFPIAMPNRGPGIKAVSNVEYWDIDGTNATRLTLTWDATSNINTLTAGALNSLTIVGWNNVLKRWLRIPSTIDGTSILGGASSLASGSITTNAALVPNGFTAYTLAALGPDVTPRVTVVPGIVNGAQRLEIVLAVLEVGGVTSTSGAVTVRAAKNTLLSNFEWNPTQTNAPANGVADANNAIWTASEADPGYYTFTTTTPLAAGSQNKLVFYLTLNPNGANGTFSIPITIPANQGGGEVNLLNNQDAEFIEFFAN